MNTSSTSKIMVISAALVMLCVLLPSVVGAVTAEDIKREIQAKEAQIKKLEEELAQYKKEVAGAKAEQKTLKSHINGLIREINSLNLEIQITFNKISSTKLNINELTLNIDRKQEEIVRLKSYVFKTIQLLQQEGGQNTLVALLKNDSLSSFLNHNHYVETLHTRLVESVDQLKYLKKVIEEEKIKLEGERTALEDQYATLSDKEEIVADQKENKEKILSITKNKESKFKTLAQEAEEKQKEIQKEIFELEERLRYTLDPSMLPKPRKGFFSMPTEGILSQDYGEVAPGSITRDFYKFHNGIDLASSTGTPIKSVMDGVVSYVGDAPYAYGKWVVIDHENGLSTLYAHMSLRKVAKGDRVKRGQLIGYMGSTGLSTGPHLHFTVYATNTFMVKPSTISGILPIGASVNPMQYL